MAAVYANLIQKGLKTLSEVPAHLKNEVERLLKNEQPFYYISKTILQEGGSNYGYCICNAHC